MKQGRELREPNPFFDVERRRLRKEEIEKRLEEMFGNGSLDEIRTATTTEKIVERIVEMSKREEQFDMLEQMRQEAKRKQRENGRLILLWRKNKCFPAQFWNDEETPEAQETLEFWRAITNKAASEVWREDSNIRGAPGNERET